MVPQAVDTDLFRPSWKIPGRIVCVGRLSREKNFGSVIEAADEWPWARVTIIGNGPIMREWWELSWGRRVCVPGQASNELVALSLSHAEYLIHPALYDQAPKVILEAMACGCCVITTNREFVEDGVTGFFCGTSKESIIAAMAVAQEADRVTIGKAAREYVLKHHALSMVATLDAAAVEEWT